MFVLYSYVGISCSWAQLYVEVTDSGGKSSFNVSGKQDEWNKIMKHKRIWGTSKIR